MIRPKIVVKNKTHILYSIIFFKMCLYVLMCKYTALTDKSQMWMLSLAFEWHSDRPPRHKYMQYVSLSLSLSIYIYMYVCVCLYIYICMYTNTSARARARAHTHTHTNTQIIVDFLSTWKSEVEYWWKSTRFQTSHFIIYYLIM
jgi:hypothetical protein